uniref:Uncharacterized protein n=1 Tax=Rhizophora mucronata TaxID=61149 RepID=A0A2P2L5W6_RHIMU
MCLLTNSMTCFSASLSLTLLWRTFFVKPLAA